MHQDQNLHQRSKDTRVKVSTGNLTVEIQEEKGPVKLQKLLTELIDGIRIDGIGINRIRMCTSYDRKTIFEFPTFT